MPEDRRPAGAIARTGAGLPGDDDPREGRAHLPGHHALGLRQPRCGEVEVGVVEDDGGGLAPELQGDAGDPFAADRRDAPAGGGRSREGDLVHPGVPHQLLGHLAVGGHDVEDPRRQADLLGHLCHQVALTGRLGGGLEDHGAAGDERGCHLVADQADGSVPGDDGPDDAHRLLESVHYEADMTAIPQPLESDVEKTSKLLLGIAVLSLIGATAAILLGGILGGGRALYRIATGKPASSMYDVEFIHLDLQEKWVEVREESVEEIEAIERPHPKG